MEDPPRLRNLRILQDGGALRWMDDPQDGNSLRWEGHLPECKYPGVGERPLGWKSPWGRWIWEETPINVIFAVFHCGLGAPKPPGAAPETPGPAANTQTVPSHCWHHPHPFIPTLNPGLSQLSSAGGTGKTEESVV